MVCIVVDDDDHHDYHVVVLVSCPFVLFISCLNRSPSGRLKGLNGVEIVFKEL